jgi:hypothetical protein
MFVLSHYQYDKNISHEYESDLRPRRHTRRDGGEEERPLLRHHGGCGGLYLLAVKNHTPPCRDE